MGGGGGGGGGSGVQAVDPAPLHLRLSGSTSPLHPLPASNFSSHLRLQLCCFAALLLCCFVALLLCCSAASLLLISPRNGLFLSV